MSLEPLSEWGSVDLDDGGFCEGVRADEFVVRRMVDDSNHTGLAGNALGSPGVVAGFEAESAEFSVTATGADKMNTLSSNTGIGGLAALLESPEAMLDMTREAIGLCIPLLTIVCALSTRGTALVTGVA